MFLRGADGVQRYAMIPAARALAARCEHTITDAESYREISVECAVYVMDLRQGLDKGKPEWASERSIKN